MGDDFMNYGTIKVKEVINKLNELTVSLQNERFHHTDAFHNKVKEVSNEYLASIGLRVDSWDVYVVRDHLRTTLLKYELKHTQDKRSKEEKGRKGRIENITFHPIFEIQEHTTFGELELLIEKEKLQEQLVTIESQRKLYLKRVQEAEEAKKEVEQRIHVISNELNKDTAVK